MCICAYFYIYIYIHMSSREKSRVLQSAATFLQTGIHSDNSKNPIYIGNITGLHEEVNMEQPAIGPRSILLGSSRLTSLLDLKQPPIHPLQEGLFAGW